jgi:hypothetical protein
MWVFKGVNEIKPSVTVNTPAMITWHDEPVTLGATIDDDGLSKVNIEWTAYPDGTVTFEPNEFVANPTVEITTVGGTRPNARIINPSFENDPLGWDYTGETPTIWSGNYQGKHLLVPTDGDWCVAVYGAWYAESGSTEDPNEESILSQTLIDKYMANTTYTLKVDVVNDGFGDGYENPFEDVRYKVQLLAGDKVIAEDDNEYPLGVFGKWETSVLIKTTGDGVGDPNMGEPLEIRLIAKKDVYEMSFDNVRLTSSAGFPVQPGETYTLTCTARDDVGSGSDTVEIDVYDGACKAARLGLSKGAENPSDLNGDCETDLKDLSEMLLTWLDETVLTEPKVKERSSCSGLGPQLGPNAEEIAIVNAGFEDPPLTDGTYEESMNGWTGFGDAWYGVSNPSDDDSDDYYGYGGITPEGENLGIAGGGDAIDRLEPGMAQILTETLATSTTYELTVEVGNIGMYDWNGYKVQLLAGGTVLAENDSCVTPADNTFETVTVTYTSGGTDPVGELLEIRLIALGFSSANNYLEVNFDDVALRFVSNDANLPSVDAGDDWVTWSDQPVALNPVVVNNDFQDPNRPLAYEWTAEGGASVVVFDPNEFVLAPTVTITAIGDPNVVTLTLAVTLQGKNPVTDTAVIDVYDDACKAAIGTDVEFAVTDFNGNCITGLGDFAEMSKAWFVEYQLEEPAVKPVVEE